MHYRQINYFLSISNSIGIVGSNKEETMKVVGLIVAAGRGYRAGGELPKQYEAVKNTRMLTLTVTALLKSKKIDGIMVVINPLDINLYIDSTKNITDNRLLPPCDGGKERSDSVSLGLKALEKYAPK